MATLDKRGDDHAFATWRSALMVVVVGWLTITMSWKMLMHRKKQKEATARGAGGGRDGSLEGVRRPPGPPSLPIIGHLHLLGRLPHQSLYKLAKKYGPLMYLKLGAVPTIVASSPEMARHVLQTHDNHMASRPATAGGKHLMFDASDLAFCPAGPYWRRMRQLCVTDLFSNRRLADFRPVREQEVRALLRVLAGEADAGCGVVCVRGPLLTAASKIISRMAFGSTLSQLVAVDRDTSIVNMITETSQLLGEFNLGDFIPWLDRLDLQGLTKRMRAIGAQLSTVFQDMIDRRRTLSCTPGGPRPPADLLDVLLSIVGEDQISDHNIKGIILVEEVREDKSQRSQESSSAPNPTNELTNGRVEHHVPCINKLMVFSIFWTVENCHNQSWIGFSFTQEGRSYEVIHKEFDWFHGQKDQLCIHENDDILMDDKHENDDVLNKDIIMDDFLDSLTTFEEVI